MKRHRLIFTTALFLVPFFLSSSGCTPTPSQETPGNDGVRQESTKEPSESVADSSTEPSPSPDVVQDASEPNSEPGSEPNSEPTPEPAPAGGTEPTPDAPDSPDTPDSPDGASKVWTLPKCTKTKGLPGFLFSPDAGKTMKVSSTPFPSGIHYTYGLVALESPNTLLAHYQNALYRSVDAGCTWTWLYNTTGGVLRLSSGVGNRAWAWSDNGKTLLRIDGSTVTRLKPPVENILGIGFDKNDKDKVRIGGRGVLFETQDGGKLWRKFGSTPPGTNTSGWYRAAFAPGQWDTILFGRVREGFWVSQDAGKTWKRSTGLTVTPGDPANGFNAVFSPANPEVVWAMAIDLKATGGSDKGKRLYRSIDGGLSFSIVVRNLQDKEVHLVNGPNLVPHPTNKDLLYWAFGTCASMYGTKFYTYDASTKKLSWTSQPYASFNTIVVSPADPKALYFGVQTNSDPLCPKRP